MNSMKEGTPREQKLGDAIPSPYIPVRARVSFLARLFWRCTDFGRTRLNLWLAQRTPDSDKLRAALERRLPGLLKDLNDRKPEHKFVLRDTLLFLGWSDLQSSTFADVMLTLSVLDRRFPASTERLTLRWDLMQRLLQSRSYLNYQNQAGLFLADPISENFGGAVLETLVAVYTNLTWEQRLGIAQSAHSSLKADPRVRAAISQWQCPASFSSNHEAHEWTQQTSQEHLDFAPIMKADALIALGRGAEWDRDWAGMEARAREALQIVPDCPEAVLLLTRSLLRQTGRTLPEKLTKAALPDELRWQRLQLQCNLRKHGGLEQAEALIAQLPRVAGNGDLMELDLCILLLETALTTPDARRPDQIAQCANLSSQLQKSVETYLDRLPFFNRYCPRCGESVESGRVMGKTDAFCPNCRTTIARKVPESAAAWLPWTEVNLALKEIHVDRSYVRAFQRLEIPALKSYFPARSLAHIARLMAGSTRLPGQENTARTSVDTLAYALNAVAGQVEIAAERQWNELQTSLFAALADSSIREFPPLIAGGEILMLAVRLLGGDESARENTLRYTVPEHAPLWAVWLFSRLVEMLIPGSDSEASLRRIPLTSPAVAWFLEVWSYNYGRLDGKLPAAASGAEEILNQSLPPNPLRTARLQDYRQHNLPADYAPPMDAFAELGEICGEHARREVTLELEIALARQSLANGEPSLAAARLDKLLEIPVSIGPLAKPWWLALIIFWHGVALAHQHDSEAAFDFQVLVNGPCAGAARGQLALLALQNGSLDEAARWLDGAPSHVPSARYANALLLARRGRPSEARLLLESSEANRIFAGSSYALPAKRLIAALGERRGNPTESERLHVAILASHPGDAIASVRLGRIRIEAVFANYRATGVPLKEEVGSQPLISKAEGVEKIAWWRPYAILEELMSVSEDALPHLERTVLEQFGTDSRSLAWRQLLAHRLLRANDANGGLRALDISRASEDSPSWFAEARLFLTTWYWLKCLSQDSTRTAANQKLRECSQGLARFKPDHSDSPVALWSGFVEKALSVESAGSLDALTLDSQSLGNPPFCFVPQLWSESAQQRRSAAEALLSALGQDGTRWNKEQVLLLRALAAWSADNDEAYIEQYTNLESLLNELPVRGRDLWVPAALVRFSKGDWQSLAGDRLPDCIADMSDPVVCLIVELADAKAAVGSLKKPSQIVAQRIKGIHNNLVALVERLDSQRSVNGS